MGFRLALWTSDDLELSKSSQVNDVDRRRLHLSLYVRIVLKILVLILNNVSIKLRPISGTGTVGSVIYFHILELPKVIKSRLKYFNRVNINYSIRQTVPNINYSISEQELSKIIVTSAFQQSKIISSSYFIDVVNQLRCNFMIIYMFNYLKNLYHVTT